MTMTLPVKKITIAGFRGTGAPLVLDFVKGASCRSMVIYGRNGTGKSSITDAWEWLHAGKVEHLAKEGAGESAYPNMADSSRPAYVEVELSDPALGTVRQEFDRTRITTPKVTGNVADLRSAAPHPCHIRFGDLTRFVYLTKTQRYDELAKLMGFAPQVDLQKSLKRVLRQLDEALDSRSSAVRRVQAELTAALGLETLSEKSVLSALAAVCVRQVGECEAVWEAVRKNADDLAKSVQSDPQAKQLAVLTSLRRAVASTAECSEATAALCLYLKAVSEFRAEVGDVAAVVLLKLYEMGEACLGAGMDPGVCPLCGREFPGSLPEHISGELEKLRPLKSAHEEVEGLRRTAVQQCGQLGSLSGRFSQGISGIDIPEAMPIDELLDSAGEVDGVFAGVKSVLDVSSEQLDDEAIGTLTESLHELARTSGGLEARRQVYLADLDPQIIKCQAGPEREQLITDQALLADAITKWDAAEGQRRELELLKEVREQYAALVSVYGDTVLADVQRRFDEISDDVATYFAILEEGTEGIASPALKLMTDQDRAVTLEVVFQGETISPAYKYLSESQLNSFGLSVFLASARWLNSGFPFLILDDVINSFDAYKRPQLIRLLKTEFADEQVLVLTHDSIWKDQLYEQCPGWVRRRFSRFEHGHGPVCTDGASPLESIQADIDADEPVRAGQALGPYLERRLQEICEYFQVLLKYNRRNEYTLDPLMDRLRVRVKDKVGADHQLTQKLEALQGDASFRNFCVHWKNPETDLTPQEIQRVLDQWQEIEKMVRCQEQACFESLRYDDSGGFRCPCGLTSLQRADA